MGKGVAIILMLASIALFQVAQLGYGAQDSQYPVAMGKVLDREGYVVLYSDYTLEIDNVKHKIININININNILYVSYSSIDDYVFLVGFYNISMVEAESIIILYDVKNSETVYYAKYSYRIVDNGIDGKMLTEAVYIPKYKAIVAMYTNTTSTYLDVIKINNKQSIEVIDVKVSFNFYTNFDGVYAVILENSTFQGRQIKLVTAVDVISGKKLAQYPSLIPVVDLAVPLVQLFNENGTWVGYVVVYNPSSGQLEYYRIEPGSLNLHETDPVIVSPDLGYAVKLTADGTYIIRPSGETIELGYDARPSPSTIYMGLEPRNGVIDWDVDGVLLRVIGQGETRLIYKAWGGGEKLVYSVEGIHNRLTGLYAVLKGEEIIISDPVKNTVIKIPKPDLEQAIPAGQPEVERDTGQDEVSGEDGGIQAIPDIPWIAALLGGVALLAMVMARRGRNAENKK